MFDALVALFLTQSDSPNTFCEQVSEMLFGYAFIVLLNRILYRAIINVSDLIRSKLEICCYIVCIIECAKCYDISTFI